MIELREKTIDERQTNRQTHKQRDRKDMRLLVKIKWLGSIPVKGKEERN